MKRYLSFGFMLLAIILTGCTATQTPFMNVDLTREDWMQMVATNPARWTAGADEWFFTGTGPSAAVDMDEQFTPPLGISTTNVNVTDFTNVRIEGDFRVQITGSNGENSVSVVGPNNEVRKVVVDMKGNLLCITQLKDQPCDMRKVVVRIAVNQLNSIAHYGCGPVEGINLRSNGLSVTQSGTGNMYLSGRIRVNKVVNEGGVLSIIGTNTPWLEINTNGPGSTNISGRVNVKTINHHGVNDINIIGACSDALFINADGGGKIGIVGTINLREVRARNNVWVLATSVNSDYTYAYVNDNAVVGMVGSSGNLYANTSQSARFFGRYLCADSAFVRASDTSHINISARKRIFASAIGNASVYFFGSPSILSQFVSGNGLAIPIWGVPACVSMEPTNYKGEMTPPPSPPRRHPRRMPEPEQEQRTLQPPPAPAPAQMDHLQDKSSFTGEIR